MIPVIVQICITLLSGSAIWLVSRKEHWRRWGYITGLLAQPFWAYTTITHHQWGMMALCLWYGYSWAQGLYFHWISPWFLKRKEIRRSRQQFQEYMDEINRLIEQGVIKEGDTWADTYCNYYIHTQQQQNELLSRH